MIALERVTKRYPDGTVAVDALSLEIPTGEVGVLVGTSGSGKTTTLRMINRMIEPTSGTITIDGRSIASLPAHELRRGIGYVIQQVGLFPHKRVIDNVMTVPILLGWDRKRARDRAHELLDLVGLDQSLARRYPSQLSGGQQQRVGVARALAADPPVLLMDEPFGAVDPIVRTQLQVEFTRLQREMQKTVVFVTHDIDEAIRIGDRIAVLGPAARLHQYGPPEELLAHPADEFVAGFLGDDRGLKLLSLRPADSVPTSEVLQIREGERLDHARVNAQEWALVTSSADEPLGWIRVERLNGKPVSRADGLTPASMVGPDGSARSLLDAAISSPAASAVRIDNNGRLLGVVTYDELGRALAEGTAP
ncbi:MAG: osmoprotectant transport system ATP-binding protein [Acidimicrobiaceae bacterium]|nr:osmoprotectant transport system ATP-binding protein [Acidimicrobiaceae bacterium]